jgi:DNA-binding response OmpR family regulator
MPHKRILLIEDDPEYTKLICHVLDTSEEPFQVQSASDLADGLAAMGRNPPDLVMLDLSLPDSSGYETFERVQGSAQGAPIIVLTGLDDDRVAIHAVEGGAADYLVKSLIQPKIILRSLQMAFGRQRRQMLPKDHIPVLSSAGVPGSVLSFIGSKGGVGTSTTALNIGAVLAVNGFETVVVELQAGPATLSLYLQTDPGPGLDSLLRKPASAITLADVQDCAVEIRRGLRLLCSTVPASPGVWPSCGADHVHAIIATIRQACSFVVLDLPARIDDGVAEALRLSDSVTLMLDLEAAAVHCGVSVWEQIRWAVAKETEVRLAVVERTALEAPLQLNHIQQRFKVQPSVIIPAAPLIALSHAARTPLVLLYPGAPYGVAHFELAEQLLPLNTTGSRWPTKPVPQLSHKITRESIPETMYS